VGGDFSWTLDPDIAATMLAAIVVGLATTKENYEDFFKLKSREDSPSIFRCLWAVKFELFKYITE
jgi:hypothetical protein